MVMRSFSIFPLLFYVVNTLIIIGLATTYSFSIPTSSGNETDRLALLDIKHSIKVDPHGVLKSWNDSVNICSWEGVTCGRRHKRVTKLNLTSKDLVGTLSPSIGNLTFLHDLELLNNTFSGPIPHEIGRLVRLQKLVFYRCGFEGMIPKNISRCLQLTSLVLSHNKLVGEIPSELSYLSKLQVLSLDFNKLTGHDLSPLSNLTSLQRLYLSGQTFQGGIHVTGFQGAIPNFFGKFKDLRVLAIGGNNFTGKIPPSLYNLSKLQTFSLVSNQLEGSLPPDLGFYFPQLQYLQIGENNLSGPIPVTLSNCSNLVLIHLADNNFSGKFLLDARNMPNLTQVNIINANLGTGEVDDLNFINTLVNCTNLELLLIGHNNFGGVLPNSIANFSSKLRSLVMEDNQISGSIPMGLSKLWNLEYLLLRDNKISGTIPSELGKIPRLQALLLSNNQLFGNIPLSLGNLSFLSELDLSFNKLQGTISTTLGNCNSLLRLGLSRNNLVGNVPHQLFQASALLELYLDNNHLHGFLPSEIGELKFLVIADLSYNNMFGTIPSSLGQCLALTNLSLAHNSFVGLVPQSFERLKALQIIDLAHNNLSGQIPSYMYNLSSLVLLNLSFNNFEGQVPTKGVFSNLSIISVAGNENLCGGILELKLPNCPKNSKKKMKMHALAIFAISIACVLVGLAIVSLVYLLLQKRGIRRTSSMNRFKEPFIKVSYDMLLKATNGFSPQNLIGSGGFGSVYKGTLLLDGVEKVVAIKVINIQRLGGAKSFNAECEALRIIRHRNLVGVITACSSIDFKGNDFKALVYELMPKGSLEMWLYSNLEDNDQLHQHLNLMQRLNIAIDVAHAMDYMHNGNDPPVIHCDLKPANILLDENMTAHVGDFGLVKLLPQVFEQLQSSSSIGFRGTVGYAAPEYGLGSSVSAAGDVYSYGIIVLELMTAKKPIDSMFHENMNLHKFVESYLPDQVMEIVDPKLRDNDPDDCDDEERHIYLNNKDGVTKCEFECIASMIIMGVRCSSDSPQDRMDIKDVIHQLYSQRDHLLLCKKGHRCQHI